MTKKQLLCEKIAFYLGLFGVLTSIVSISLIFASTYFANEALLDPAGSLAYYSVLISLIVFILTIYAVGIKNAEKDGGLGLLRYRAGKLGVIIFAVGIFAVGIWAAQVRNNEITSGERNADGSIAAPRE